MPEDRCPQGCGDEIIGIEVWGLYDGVLYWQCTGCGSKWHRFPDDERLSAKAQPFIDDDNEPPWRLIPPWQRIGGSE